MHNDKDLSTWQTFRRLWPTIAPFKAGLIVAGVALILNAASDTFMLSLLKPLLDDGFGKTDRSVLVWMPLVVIGLMILRGITSYVSSYCISWVSGKVVMTTVNGDAVVTYHLRFRTGCFFFFRRTDNGCA